MRTGFSSVASGPKVSKLHCHAQSVTGSAPAYDNRCEVQALLATRRKGEREEGGGRMGQSDRGRAEKWQQTPGSRSRGGPRRTSQG